MAEEERKNVLIAVLLKETRHSLKGFQGSAPEPVSGTNAALLVRTYAIDIIVTHDDIGWHPILLRSKQNAKISF